MNLPPGIFLFGVAFFGFMAVVNALQAYRKRERAYYLAAMVGFLVLLAFVFAFLNQLIVALALVVATGIMSIAGLPKLLKVQERELTNQLREVDLSAPLKRREFLTNKGWLKLTSKWGLWKTMCLFYLISAGIIGGIFSILSTFYSFIAIGYVASYTVIFPILTTLMFYRQFKKALENRSLNHLTRP
ncbi:MAG: hypothetical protein OEZ29_07145 [Candidatus Bathyarchaeota archaeon]|nr:hypothetical protein [Candidatus Bathyarchaeota archaeon]